jgi:hypothetical protein
MKNTGISFLVATFAFTLGACATEAEHEQTTNVAHSKDATCESKPDFANWYEVMDTREKQPELYKAALGAALQVGATCTEEGSSGCEAVSPDDDVFAKRGWSFPFVACWRGTTTSWPEGREYVECCIVGGPAGPTGCDWAWINTGPTVPDQPQPQ